MLVISRRKGQRVTIGDDIEIVITAVHKNGVKLGIAAPRDFTVLRGEVRDAIFSANMEATKSSLADAEAIAGAAPAAAMKTSLPAAKLALGRHPADANTSQREDGRATNPTLGERLTVGSARPTTTSVRPPAGERSDPAKPETP